MLFSLWLFSPFQLFKNVKAIWASKSASMGSGQVLQLYFLIIQYRRLTKFWALYIFYTYICFNWFFRERWREKGIETLLRRETLVSCLRHAPLGTEPATWPCAQTGNGTNNLFELKFCSWLWGRRCNTFEIKCAFCHCANYPKDI